MTEAQAQTNPAPVETARKKSVLVVIPVYNEERVLLESMMTLTTFLDYHDNYNWQVVIADNASKDGTGDIGRIVSKRYPNISYLYIPRKGRGIALRTAWTNTDCDFVSYMDVDLSTSMKGLVRAVEMLDAGAQIVVGNRLHAESGIKRCFKREFVSRSYNVVIRHTLGTHFHDAHCGFKTARRDVAQALLPYIEDNEWFFDTEFLFYAERLGYRIDEIPVIWIEDLNTKAKIFKDAKDDLQGLWRLKFHNKLGQKLAPVSAGTLIHPATRSAP